MLSTNFITSSVSMVDFLFSSLIPSPRFFDKYTNLHTLANYRFKKISDKPDSESLRLLRDNDTAIFNSVRYNNLVWKWELNFNALAIYQSFLFGCGNEFQFRRLSHRTKQQLISFVLSLTLFTCFLVSFEFLFLLT